MFVNIAEYVKTATVVHQLTMILVGAICVVFELKFSPRPATDDARNTRISCSIAMAVHLQYSPNLEPVRGHKFDLTDGIAAPKLAASSKPCILHPSSSPGRRLC
jgi:hypothetical protein